MNKCRCLVFVIIVLITAVLGACSPGGGGGVSATAPVSTAGTGQVLSPGDNQAEINTELTGDSESEDKPEAAENNQEAPPPGTYGTESVTNQPSGNYSQSAPSPSLAGDVGVPPSNSPAADSSGAKADGLIITGNGVGKETVWTLSQLQSMQDGYREIKYSTTNNWPTFGNMTAQGISLRYLLRQAGMISGAVSFKLVASDGYSVNVTYSQIFGRQYAYSNHSPAGSDSASEVEPILAWMWGEEGKLRAEKLRSFFGQNGPMEVNTSVSVNDIRRIEVSASSVAAWAPPTASIADGSTVPAGTGLAFLHESLDSVRVYYTLDGSQPTYDSAVYNPSTSYFQPQQIKPLKLTKSVTVKAFAAGYGKDSSPIVTFNYVVQ